VTVGRRINVGRLLIIATVALTLLVGVYKVATRPGDAAPSQASVVAAATTDAPQVVFASPTLADPTTDSSWCAQVGPPLQQGWMAVSNAAQAQAAGTSALAGAAEGIQAEGQSIIGLRTTAPTEMAAADYQLGTAMSNLGRLAASDPTNFSAGQGLGESISFAAGEVQGYCASQGYDPADYPTSTTG